jgi:hypothetical protein
MGYSSSYRLKCKPETDELVEFFEGVSDKLDLCECEHCKRCRKLEEKASSYPVVCEYGNEWLYYLWIGDVDSCKWYEHEEDMRKLSALFPDVLFTLSGEGEESGDIWKMYVKGGKSHSVSAEIVLPEFDETKLK